MNRQLYVNLPVSDLKKSIDFFSSLDFTFNPVFTDENATCMIISEDTFVMLLVEPFYASFTTKPTANTQEVSAAIMAISASSREEVDIFADKAMQNGAQTAKDFQDHGFMYSRSFYDLDGHMWEVMWMDPAAATGGSEE